MNYLVSLGTIHILHQPEKVGSENIFFADVQYCIEATIEGGVGGSEKVQNFANIIHGWSLIVSCSFVNPLRQLDPVIN